MADYYKLSGSRNRHTDWTTEVVLERDENGEPTRVISAANAGELNAEDRKKVEALGYTLERASASEAGSSTPVATTDVTGTAPVFGVSDSDLLPASDREDGGEGSSEAEATQQASGGTKAAAKSNDNK